MNKKKNKQAFSMYNVIDLFLTRSKKWYKYLTISMPFFMHPNQDLHKYNHFFILPKNLCFSHKNR